MARTGALEVEGVVAESLPSAMFRIELANGQMILAHLSSKLRLNLVKILPGDRVKVELSPFDQSRGRIVFRSK